MSLQQTIAKKVTYSGIGLHGRRADSLCDEYDAGDDT